MNRETRKRIQEMSRQLEELQAHLGRLSVRSVRSVRNTKELNAAQLLAAKMDYDLEDWHLHLLHIPESDRSVYRCDNPFIEKKQGVGSFH
jgi:hypothetical protein